MSERDQPIDEPYGDFCPFDPECPRVKELAAHRGREMTAGEAAGHRDVCDRCQTYAILTSEIVL